VWNEQVRLGWSSTTSYDLKLKRVEAARLRNLMKREKAAAGSQSKKRARQEFWANSRVQSSAGAGNVGAMASKLLIAFSSLGGDTVSSPPW
jgi:hypothetical protein